MDDVELIQENMQSLRFWAASLSGHLPPVMDFDDLLMAGISGLLASKHKHKPSKSSRKTYFSYKIRGAVLDEIRELRPGSRQYQEFDFAVFKVRDNLAQELGREPSLYEIAQRMGMDESDLNTRLLCLPTEMLRLNQNFPEDKIPDKKPLPIESMELDEVKEMLQRLPERLRYVLEQYYFENRYMVDIGTDLGVTESRICQLHKQAIAELRSLYSSSR